MAESPVLTRMRDMARQDGLRRTQAWLADRLGVDPSTLNLWLWGERTLPEARRREIALVLSMDVADVVPGERQREVAA